MASWHNKKLMRSYHRLRQSAGLIELQHRTRPTEKILKLVLLVGALNTAVIFDAAAQSAQAVLVEVSTITNSTIRETREYVGSFVSPQQASVSTQTSGQVSEVLADIGSRVTKGAPIIRLNTDIADLQLQRTQALLEQRTIELTEATRLLAEAERLNGQEILPETELLARKANVDVAQAALTQAKTNYRIAQTIVQQHTIQAPFDGTIVERSSERGEWVTPGTQIVQMVSTDNLWIDVYLPQARWPSIDTLTSIEVTVDALPEQRLPAKLIAKVPASQAQTRTFLTRLALIDDQPQVTPGMSAEVHMQFNLKDAALAVPRDALLHRLDGSTAVWVAKQIDSGWVAHEKVVTTGPTSQANITILSGLTAGDKVVIRGNENLRSNQSIRFE